MNDFNLPFLVPPSSQQEISDDVCQRFLGEFEEMQERDMTQKGDRCGKRAVSFSLLCVVWFDSTWLKLE